MSVVEGTVVQALQAATLTPREAQAAPAARLRRSGSRVADFVILGGWGLPALDFVALTAAFACSMALTNDGDARIALAVFPFLGVLVLAARGADALRLRLIALDSLRRLRRRSA